MIQGYLEYVQAFRVHGWAYDSQNPDRHVTVEIMCGDARLGEARADMFREDLKTGGIGAGDHAFAFDILDPLSNDDLQKIAARAVTQDGPLPLVRLTYTPVEAGDVAAEEALDNAFRGAASDDEQHPLFILGSTRSGTSAFAEAIAASGKFWGQKEGQLLDLFAHLRDSVRAFYDEKQRSGAVNEATFISRVPMAFFLKGLRHIFVELIRTAAPSPYWFDKTPNHHMIHLAPHFLAMWPNAKFIFLKRRAPEFIESRRRKFPQSSFEENCRSWAATMQSWTAVRDQLKGCAMEIDQLALANSPKTVAINVAAFVGFDHVQARRFSQALADGRPEQTGRDAAAILQMDHLDWGPDDHAVFDSICAPLMERYGYARDESYRLAEGPHRWLTSMPHAIAAAPSAAN